MCALWRGDGGKPLSRSAAVQPVFAGAAADRTGADFLAAGKSGGNRQPRYPANRAADERHQNSGQLPQQHRPLPGGWGN